MEEEEVAWKKCTAMTLLAVLLQSSGLLLFVLGFFPVKPALTGISGIESLRPICYGLQNHTSPPFQPSYYQELSGIDPLYDRLIIMVIDGLPAEFILGKDSHPPSKKMADAMPYTQHLRLTRRAIGFHSKAAPPTVTMPRLKAITSGAIAGFLDVAFNFNTQALLDDNLIGQLGRAGWKMVMHGDETWLRMFPNAFIRYDGVSSFYVKDTVEVDANVTRHLETELKAEDWDLLILHYLGLDHVGHIGGRCSPLMVPKLKEMDTIIRQLDESLISSANSRGSRTLVLVLSDHGMTDGGSHGGATSQETDALALFIAQQKFQSLWDENDNLAFQVDLVPTLALLLGLPIPRNSIGVLIPHLLSSLDAGKKLRAFELNSWQLMRLLQVRYPNSFCVRSICSNETLIEGLESDRVLLNICLMFVSASKLHQSWRRQLDGHIESSSSSDVGHWKTVADAYIVFLKTASDLLARGTTEKNTLFIHVGGLFMLLALSILSWLSVSNCRIRSTDLSWQTGGLESMVALGGVFVHAMSFLSSSLVEEEHFTWQYLVTTLCFVFFRRACQMRCSGHISGWKFSLSPYVTSQSLKTSNTLTENLNLSKKSNEGNAEHVGKLKAQVLTLIVLLMAKRILQAWHRGGVNWTHLPDIARWLDQIDPRISSALRVTSILFVTFLCIKVILDVEPWQHLQKLIAIYVAIAGFLTHYYAVQNDNSFMHLPNDLPILLAQSIYALLGFTALLAFIISPWNSARFNWMSETHEVHICRFVCLMRRERLCVNYVGRVFISCWCILQLLLQQNVNAGAFAVLLLQLVAILIFFNNAGCVHNLWIRVLTLCWMGACGHFGLGNTNTLATVDVAGAYIGLRKHSTFLSGLLAFIITYSSPMLFMLGLILVASSPDNINAQATAKESKWRVQYRSWWTEMVAIPSLLPLTLNAVVVMVFTIVMVFMQGHLFVWSVFSPKYLYICAATVCTYIGVLINTAIVLYTRFIFFCCTPS